VSESETKAGNGTNGFGMPLFGFPKSAFGAFAEQGEKIKAASEEMGEALRETYSSNAKGATDYGLKVIEISNANTASAIDFFAHLLGSKSVTDVFALSAVQARKGFDTASAQNKELWALAQKLAVDTGEPVRKRVAKVFQKVS
jgi:phasin